MRFHEDRCSSGYSHSDSAVLSPRDSATSMRVHEAGGEYVTSLEISR